MSMCVIYDNLHLLTQTFLFQNYEGVLCLKLGLCLKGTDNKMLHLKLFEWNLSIILLAYIK